MYIYAYNIGSGIDSFIYPEHTAVVNIRHPDGLIPKTLDQ